MSYEKVVRSGDLLEYYKYERTPIGFQRGRYSRDPRKERAGKGYKRHVKRRADNVQRSVRAFRRLVRANLVGDENPALLTLTMLQILPLKTSFGILTQFFVRARKRFGRAFKFIAVPEFQKRGAVHFHVLVWGWKKEIISEERTTREIQRLWCAGFIDCIETDGSPKLAGYLSKYLSKAMHDVRLGGEKAYSASRNVLRSMSVGTRSFSNEVREELGLNSEPRHVHVFQTMYLGTCEYKAFLVPFVNGKGEDD